MGSGISVEERADRVKQSAKPGWATKSTGFAGREAIVKDGGLVSALASRDRPTVPEASNQEGGMT
jgi:hypothetical protein